MPLLSFSSSKYRFIYKRKGAILLKPYEEVVSPEGYRLTEVFQYPRRLLYVATLLPAFSALSFYIVANRGLVGVGIFRGTEGLEIFVFMTLVFFTTNIIRGLVQRGMSYGLGYGTVFYPLLSAPLEGTFALAPGQVQSRRDALLVALAPLSLFAVLWLPLVFGLSGLIGGALAFFLVVNIAGTSWDLYFVWWLVRKSKGVKLSAASHQELLVFELTLSEV